MIKTSGTISRRKAIILQSIPKILVIYKNSNSKIEKANQGSKTVTILTKIGYSFRTNHATLLHRRQIQALYPILGGNILQITRLLLITIIRKKKLVL